MNASHTQQAVSVSLFRAARCTHPKRIPSQEHPRFLDTTVKANHNILCHGLSKVVPAFTMEPEKKLELSASPTLSSTTSTSTIASESADSQERATTQQGTTQHSTTRPCQDHANQSEGEMRRPNINLCAVTNPSGTTGEGRGQHLD